MGIKKSQIVERALNYLVTPEEGEPQYLCIAVSIAARNLGVTKMKLKIQKDVEEAIKGHASAWAYLQSKRDREEGYSAKLVTNQEAYEFRVELANKLIKQYKEEECQTIYTKLSKVFNKLKETLKSKLF